MGKNKGGGKHKHRKNETIVKINFVKPSEEIFYVYVTKAYGNRMFDGIIIRNREKIRFKAMMRKKRSQRVSVGGIIKMSMSRDFSEIYYAVEDVCNEEEYKMIEKSDEYIENVKMIRNEHDISFKDCGSSVYFEDDDNLNESINIEEDEDEDEDEDFDIDNL